MRLATPPGKSNAIRPTSDRCREALFSILGERLDDATILDLYAGTGALALEALSRGAKSAVLVDNSSTALALLRKNVLRLKKYNIDNPDFCQSITIIKSDLRKGLNAIVRSSKSTSTTFDIIFLDPPYGKGLAQRTLKDLDSNSFLATGGLVVAEERSKVVLSEKFAHLKCIDTRKYGDTRFWIYTIS